MRIDSLYDQGTAREREDMLICREYDGFGGLNLIAAVLDGVSGLYTPESGPRLFRGLTGGQVVCNIASNIIESAPPGETLNSVFRRLNNEIMDLILEHGIPMERSDIIPGAAFAATRIRDGKIEIIQGADCFAVWLCRDGTIGATPNQVFAHDREMRKVMADLMEKHASDRNKAWEEFAPTLSQARLARVNKEGEYGYALLNGQKNVSLCWQEFNLSQDQIDLLLLFSDGLVHFEDTENPLSLGRMVVNLYQQGSLPRILERTRRIEEKEKEKSHIDHSEATAIAIEF